MNELCNIDKKEKVYDSLHINVTLQMINYKLV